MFDRQPRTLLLSLCSLCLVCQGDKVKSKLHLFKKTKKKKRNENEKNKINAQWVDRFCSKDEWNRCVSHTNNKWIWSCCTKLSNKGSSFQQRRVWKTSLKSTVDEDPMLISCMFGIVMTTRGVVSRFVWMWRSWFVWHKLFWEQLNRRYVKMTHFIPSACSRAHYDVNTTRWRAKGISKMGWSTRMI